MLQNIQLCFLNMPVLRYVSLTRLPVIPDSVLVLDLSVFMAKIILLGAARPIWEVPGLLLLLSGKSTKHMSFSLSFLLGRPKGTELERGW